MTEPLALFLEVLGSVDAGSRPRLPLGERILRVGRAPENDLVLAEATVSAAHATVWVERGLVRVRDQASTNGTWLDGVRVVDEATMGPGQTLRLGTRTELRLVQRGAVAPRLDALRLEVVEDGLSVPLPVEGVRCGLGDGVDVSLPLSDVQAFRVVPAGRGATLHVPGAPVRPARLGEVFAVGGFHFRVLPADGDVLPTVGQDRPTDRYHLRVSQGALGVEAWISDPAGGVEHRIEAENRAILLFVLVSRLLDDRAARVPVDQEGWCGDEDLARGIWGREAGRMEANNLNVLLHRLRRELTDAGFETAFLEKRRRATRTRLVHVTRA